MALLCSLWKYIDLKMEWGGEGRETGLSFLQLKTSPRLFTIRVTLEINVAYKRLIHPNC